MKGEAILSRAKRWLSWLFLLSAAIVLLLPLLQALTAAPVEANVSAEPMRLSFALSRNSVFLPSECVIARWQVEGIREVYFNGEGVIGTGERMVCPAFGPAMLRAVLRDGSEQPVVLQAEVTSVSRWAFAAYAYAVTVLIFIIRWGKLPALTRIAQKAGAMARKIPAQTGATGHWAQANPLWVVTGITLFGAALRFTLAGHRPLIFDEAMLEIIATGPISQVLRQNAAWNSAPPLFALTTNAILLAGNAEILLRAIPLLSSIMVIPAFYTLVRHFTGRWAAYLATLGIATALMPVYYAHYLREYSLTLLLSILILIAFLNYRTQRTRQRLIMLGACWVISIFTQYGLALLILPLNLWLLRDAWIAWRQATKEESQRLIRWTGALQFALLLAVGLVFILSLRDHLQGGSFAGDSYLQMSYWDQRPASLPGYLIYGALSYATFAFGAGLFGEMWEMGAALWLTGIGALSALLALRNTRLSLLRQLGLITFAIALVFGLYRLFPFSGGRQTIFLSVFIFLLMGAAFEVLLAQRQRSLTAIAVIGALLMVFNNVQNVTRYYTMPGYDDATTAAAYIDEHWREGDQLLLVNYSNVLFEHYFLQPHPERRATSHVVDNSPAQYGPVLEQMRAAPGRIWVVLTSNQAVFEDYVAQQPYAGQMDKAQAWTNIHVYLIDPNR